MISDLTYKVVAFKEIEPIPVKDILDWTTEMLKLDYDSPSLYMLASFEKSSSFYDMVKYLENSIRELDLDIKYEEDAIISYISSCAIQIIKRENIRKNLKEIMNFNWEWGEVVLDFSDLYWAWEDFDWGEKTSFYYENATPQNIEEKVIKYAQEWLEEHKFIWEQTL